MILTIALLVTGIAALFFKIGGMNERNQLTDNRQNELIIFRGEFYRDLSSEMEVNWRKRHIYDSTAIQAVIRYLLKAEIA